MTSAAHLYTPRAKINLKVLNSLPANTGFQATWLKNPDGVTQGVRWLLTQCGRDCHDSPGCDLCLIQAQILWAKKNGERTPKVHHLPDNLTHPFRWKKRKNVLVCPEGDLFHENIPDDFVLEAFKVMKACPQHNFIVTTKRDHHLSVIRKLSLPNVFVGVSVESQEFMYRADALLSLKGFKKVLFVAPMLTEVQIPKRVLKTLDWVICSPERGGVGRDARPCEEEWLMSLILQVKNYGLPFFLDMKYQVERINRMKGKYMEIHSDLLD